MTNCRKEDTRIEKKSLIEFLQISTFVIAMVVLLLRIFVFFHIV